MENNIIKAPASGVAPQYTSTPIGSEERAIPREHILEYFLEQTGYTIQDYVSGKIFEVAAKAVGNMLKPDILGAFQTGLEIYDLLQSIDTAMTALELGTAIINMPSGARYFVAISNNYEWLSGSGNHIAYYSIMTYLYRN